MVPVRDLFARMRLVVRDLIRETAKEVELVVTGEEGVGAGGLSSAITDVLVDKLGRSMPAIRRIALPDTFPHHYGVQEEQFELYGLTGPQIAATVGAPVASVDGDGGAWT